MNITSFLTISTNRYAKNGNRIFQLLTEEYYGNIYVLNIYIKYFVLVIYVVMTYITMKLNYYISMITIHVYMFIRL